jgi:MarC family membrane protein
MSIVSAALILFFVMDPLGNIPVFSTILGRVSPSRRRLVLGRELVISLLFLLLFLFAGQAIMELLSLKQDSIRVGGGMVLFLIALRLIFPPERGLFGETIEGEPLVFPLAVPLIAGPSSFAAVLLLVKTEPARRWEWLLALVCAWVASALLLSASELLLRVIGRRGLMAIERLTGMLLVMISVQMVLEGVRGFLAAAKG